jgi:hypothetical protein
LHDINLFHGTGIFSYSTGEEIYVFVDPENPLPFSQKPVIGSGPE